MKSHKESRPLQASSGRPFVIVTNRIVCDNRNRIKQASPIVKKIPLFGKYGNGKFALVDDDLFEVVKHRRWTVSVNGYVISNRTYLHHLAVERRPGLFIDHRNKNKLENRRENLRLCKKAEHGRNHRIFSTNQSGFHGVSRWGKSKWEARIWHNYRCYRLGVFDTAEEAASFRDQVALELHGDYASLSGEAA